MDSTGHKKQLECELRGPITWSDFFDLKKRIEEDFGKFVVTKELAIFIKGEHDLRIKINSKGGRLVYKQGIGVNDYKKEVEIDIESSEILKLIEIISLLGFNNSVYSFVEKYNAKKDNKSFSVKFGSRIGDFFEIETLLEDDKDVHLVTTEMENYVKSIGLSLWSNEAYDDLQKSSWKDVNEMPMFDISKHTFNKTIADSVKKIFDKDAVFDKTIKEILEIRSNDYVDEEVRFYNAYNQKLDSESPIIGRVFKTKTSIVIPTYNSKETLPGTLLAIDAQGLTADEFKLLEVVVVDDGSTDNTHQEINQINFKFELKYLKQNHLGTGNARNTGVAISKGDIIIFIDSDILLEKNFVREHVLRHEVIEKGVFVSFKENVDIEHNCIADFIKKGARPDIHNDFRSHKEVDPEWLRMHRHVRSVECRNVKILEETDNFKTFGMNKTLGVWDLSSMVVTCAVSMKKSEFIDCGGFNLQFRGWGMEDTFLGSCLIVRGNFIIPVFSTGIFHINHSARSGSEEQKLKEFSKNVLVYLDLVGQRANRVIKNLNDR